MSEGESMQLEGQDIQIVDNPHDSELHQGITIPPLGLEPPRDSRGRIDWRTLGLNPVNLKSYIDAEVAELISSGITITQTGLSDAGKRALLSGIDRYYPGGLYAVKEKFDVKSAKPNGYWTKEKIEEEARKAMKLGISLTAGSLSRNNMGTLGAAIEQHYHGTFAGLRAELGDNSVRKLKPSGYWKDHKNIEADAMKVVDLGIDLSQSDLMAHGFSSLGSVISTNYPEGYEGLRKKLGLPTKDFKPTGDWKDPDTIRAEAKIALGLGLDLNANRLRNGGQSSLAHAIASNYRGSYSALRKDLNLDTVYVSRGYWKEPANIENEARAAIAENIEFTKDGLKKAGKEKLVSAIRKRYPGGISALREKLGLDEVKVSPDQADEMMRGLEVLP